MVACDFSAAFIERARARSAEFQGRIEYSVVDATDLDALLELGERSFDAAICTQALMDMPVIAPVFEAASRLIKPDGRFVITVPHPCFNVHGMSFTNPQNEARPYAVVTGASSGIGEAFARRLAADGYRVAVHGRRRERLEALADDLRQQHGTEVELLVADLSQDGELHRLEERLANDRPVDMLVNNAGLTHLAPFDELDFDTVEEMIRVHVLALTRLTRAVLPGMMARGRGDIINVSSDGVFVTYPSPVMAIYAATKAYVNTFTRALHRLAGERGVRVQALCPGFVTSEILERHGITFEDWGIPPEVVMSAADQVACSLAGLELGEIVCVPTLDDPALLERIADIEDIIREKSSGTGIPAARYGV